MEMMECLTYQFSVVASPCAKIYVISKYDLIRHTSKLILHKLFCDYKARLSDERIVHRLKQMHRWNNYKRDLWVDIQNKRRQNNGAGELRQEGPQRSSTGGGELTGQEVNLIGKGYKLWDKRAQTPTHPHNTSSGTGKPSGGHQEHFFRVHVVRKESCSLDVVVKHEARDASMAALDEKILRTIATARFRNNLRAEDLSGPGGAVDSARHPRAREHAVSAGAGSASSSSPLRSLVAGSQGSQQLAPRTPRSPRDSGRRTPLTGRRCSRSHPVKRAEDLDERAKERASEYLKEHAAKIERLKAEAHRKVNPGNQPARRASGMLSARRRSSRMSVDTSGSPTSHRRSSGSLSPKQTFQATATQVVATVRLARMARRNSSGAGIWNKEQLSDCLAPQKPKTPPPVVVRKVSKESCSRQGSKVLTLMSGEPLSQPSPLSPDSGG